MMASTAEILTRMVRRGWLMTLLVVLGALAGLGYARLAPPTYTATAYVVAVAQNPTESAATVSYAQAYARIVPHGEVLDAAAAASQGSASVAELRRQVRAASSPDAPVIEVVGSARTAPHAAELANLTASALVATGAQHSTDTRITLSLLSSATVPGEPATPRPARDVAVGAAAGLLLAGLAALAGAVRPVGAQMPPTMRGRPGIARADLACAALPGTDLARADLPGTDLARADLPGTGGGAGGAPAPEPPNRGAVAPLQAWSGRARVTTPHPADNRPDPDASP